MQQTKKQTFDHLNGRLHMQNQTSFGSLKKKKIKTQITETVLTSQVICVTTRSREELPCRCMNCTKKSRASEFTQQTHKVCCSVCV